MVTGKDLEYFCLDFYYAKEVWKLLKFHPINHENFIMLFEERYNRNDNIWFNYTSELVSRSFIAEVTL